MVEIGGVPELGKVIVHNESPENSANDMLSRGSGFIIKTTANVTGTGSVVANVLQFTGSILIINQWAIITAVTTLTNLTNLYATAYDGINSVDLTSDGLTLSGAPVGSYFTKDKVASQPYSANISDEVRILETTGDRFSGRPFTLTAKNGVANFIRLHYTTTDNPIDISIQISFEYKPLNGGTLAFL